MRERACVLFLAVLALGGSCNANARSLLADLDRDGTSEYVSITCTTIVNGHPLGVEIVVSHKTPRGQKAIWRQPGLNPWKVELADVDGDGRKEVIAGVWKKSRYDPVMAKRVFVYSWNGTRLMPRWLGSRLNRRFTDFVLCPLDKDGKTELIAVEVAPRAASYITVYRWRSFGFDWIGRAGPVEGVSIAAGNRKVVVVTKSGRYALYLLKQQVILKRIREANSVRQESD